MRIPHTLAQVLSSPLRYPLEATGLSLLFHTLLRALFFLQNRAGAGTYSPTEAILAFIQGIRFDLAAYALLSGIPIILLCIPTPMLRRPATYRVAAAILATAYLISAFLNCLDVVYYGFANKRTTHEFFTTKDDLGNFHLSDFVPFWWLFIIWLGGAALMWWLLARRGRRAAARQRALGPNPRWQWALPLLAAALLFIGMRGGLQHRPLRPANAFTTSSFFLGNVALNTTYTVISSIDIGKERPLDMMPRQQAIDITRSLFANDFDGPYISNEYPLVRKAAFEGPENKLNVVLLIIESFNALKAGAVMGHSPEKSLTPNFDTLARHGLLFTNFYANGSRSVESLPALLNGMPDVFKRPIIGSSSETNTTWGIGNILHHKGYHTSFFCGGENGTMGFDAYSRVSGIQHYYGRDEFGGDPAQAGNWGVHDLPFSQWLAEMQGTFQQPFFSTWFSISNHFPFDIPPDCPEHIRQRGLKPNDLTLAYTDHALGQYFRTVRSQPWAQNTLFLITGDHCFYGADDPARAMMTNFQVPLLILGPGITPGRDPKLACHLNVPPTLLQLLRLDVHHAFAGVSLFSQKNKPIALNNLMGVVTLATDTLSYSTSFDRVQPCFSGQNGQWARAEWLETGTAAQTWDQRLRAIYQVCNNTRIENKVFSSQFIP